MAKVLVERPRLRRPPRGQGSPYPRGKLKGIFERDLDNTPSKLGMKFPHAEKWLNENLAPLRRYVLAQVGRPWDRVRAEIAAHVRRTSAVQAHIFEHLDGYVVEHVEMIDGKPHARRWGKSEPITGYRGTPLWVCPRTGRLRPPLAASKPSSRFGRAVRLDLRHELREVDGRWVHVTLAPIPVGVSMEGLYDRLLDERLAHARYFDHRQRYKKLFGRSDAIAVGVREPGLRELAILKKRLAAERL
jgi:hypothetical protein